MALSRKFKFVSPGISLREIDDSRLPREPEAVGPVVIGRTRKGPSLVPVKVNSFGEFAELFGTPVAGVDSLGDVWRNGNDSAPTYAAYAAQAWLANNGPLTVVRLAGAEHPDAGDAGKAGWKTAKTIDPAVGDNGGAYGLFVWPSGTLQGFTDGGDHTFRYMVASTGTLAAIWYLQEGAITLNGRPAGASSAVKAVTSSISALALSTGDNAAGGEWKVDIRDAAGDITDTVTFDFTRGSANFIRKVFNTSPVQASTRRALIATDDAKSYWLGESFESNVARLKELTGYNSTGTQMMGAILAVQNGSGAGGTFEDPVTRAETGWFISQDPSAATGSFQAPAQQKLFKFKALPAGGAWDQQNIKISLTDIAYSNNEEADPYGSFTILIRDAKDSDAEMNILEAYTAVNLNPNSPNFISRRIGDKDRTWDSVKRVYRTLGTWPNLSNYVTVEVNSQVEDGTVNAQLLPFGFFGPPRYKTASFRTNSSVTAQNPATMTFVTAGSASLPYSTTNGWITGSAHGTATAGGAAAGHFTGSILPTRFPSLEDFLRLSASAGQRLGDIEDAYFGVQTDIDRGASDKFDHSYNDLVRRKPSALSTFGTTAGATEVSFVFTLDNITGSGAFNNLRDAWYVSGSRKAGTSMTAVSASNGGYKEVLDAGINKFTAPMFGGTDGVDITEMDPFNNAALVGKNERSSSPYNSIRRAIDTVSDAERIEMNLLALPGVDNVSLTQHMINTCEGRGDSLAIIDIEGGYIPRAESNSAIGLRVGNVKTAIDSIKSRRINSSYGCAYYPWVQIVDSENDARLWVPPSIAALGTFASSERSTALWFAPAGFNRGGLTQGSAGINVSAVDGQLTSKDRDKLYAVNVNPIASFPAEGIVIFGQKTLQATPSALDRINVRRLLIYIKREISAIAATTLFEQNIDSTWNNFSSRAETFLESVKVGGGLTDFRVVLDDTTTTPDLIDRNILYAQVLLKPARAIEFIAVDFVIKRSGASFDD